MSPAARVFVAAKAWLHHDGRVLLMRSRRGWDLPGGRIDEEEFGLVALEDVLRRELLEETGQDDVKILGVRGTSQWTIEMPESRRKSFVSTST